VPDLLGSNKLNKLRELIASASVYTQHTLLMHRDAVQLQRNFVLGIATDHQHTALQSPNIQSYLSVVTEWLLLN